MSPTSPTIEWRRGHELVHYNHSASSSDFGTYRICVKSFFKLTEQLSSRSWCLNFGLYLSRHPYIMYVSNGGSGVTVCLRCPHIPKSHKLAQFFIIYSKINYFLLVLSLLICLFDSLLPSKQFFSHVWTVTCLTGLAEDK